MVRYLKTKFTRDDKGATAVEYGLLLGLLVIALVGGVTAVGGAAESNFNAAAESYPD